LFVTKNMGRGRRILSLTWMCGAVNAFGGAAHDAASSAMRTGFDATTTVNLLAGDDGTDAASSAMRTGFDATTTVNLLAGEDGFSGEPPKTCTGNEVDSSTECSAYDKSLVCPEYAEECPKTCCVAGPPATSSPAIQAAGSPSILVVGDSFGEFSGQTLQQFCKGSTVVNKAIASSTAEEWWKQQSCPKPTFARDCNIENVLKSVAPTDFTHVLMSLGGNDFMDSLCPTDAASMAKFEQKLTGAIKTLQNKVPGAVIVSTGYCTPREIPWGMTSCTPSAFAKGQAFMGKVIQANGGVFIPSSGACGAVGEGFSDTQYMFDPIHLNTRGYCKVFSSEGVQKAFNCGAQSYDCSTITTAKAFQP